MGNIFYKNLWLSYVILLLTFLFLCWLFCADIVEAVVYFYNFIIDKDRVKAFILSVGFYAPFVFMILQLLQVIFAPIPGEATGFIGGYIFGGFLGFLYSSFSLTVGSCVVFLLGRILGQKYIRMVISENKLSKFESLVNTRGFGTVLLCFLFPGFPKDCLCWFLGFANMSLKKFLLLVSIGRIPGTLFLSLQGAAVFDGNYDWLLISLAVLLIIFCLAVRYKKIINNKFVNLD